MLIAHVDFDKNDCVTSFHQLCDYQKYYQKTFLLLKQFLGKLGAFRYTTVLKTRRLKIRIVNMNTVLL